jgi:hypothetical protein
MVQYNHFKWLTSCIQKSYLTMMLETPNLLNNICIIGLRNILITVIISALFEILYKKVIK